MLRRGSEADATMNHPKEVTGRESRLPKRLIALVHDVLWVPLAIVLAYLARFNFEEVPPQQQTGMWILMAVALVVQPISFQAFGLYRGIWRFASLPDLARILKAVAAGASLSYVALYLLERLEGVPRSVVLLYPLFLTLGLIGDRVLYRWVQDKRQQISHRGGRRALILGAGQAGDMLVRDLLRSDKYVPVGFLDDAVDKQGRELHGVPVLGPLSSLEKEVVQRGIEAVLIAMPSARSRVIRPVVEQCKRLGVHCVTLPSLAELADGRVGLSRLREIRIDDLLGRAPVALEDARIRSFLQGRRVLVTGAGGSIGSEICRQVRRYGIDRLVMVDHGEFNLYLIEQEMRRLSGSGEVTALLGDVRDTTRMRWIFEQFRPEVVLHAAAYKHVPLVEDNPFEGVKTNVFGTRGVANLADEFGVQTFVLISTDKAVNPTNVMGASKRIAELYCQGLNARSATAFITTRFGNVLGSAGSVVPLFRRQIEEGGPVTVTHPEMTRYFMTIPEAVSLVLQAASMGRGGEIFVLDMGEPVKVVDLAQQMIQLAGYEPGKDITIEFIGLRPGEKLFEELFHDAEHLLPTSHPKILLAQARSCDFTRLEEALDALWTVCSSGDEAALRAGLKGVVPEFQG